MTFVIALLRDSWEGDRKRYCRLEIDSRFQIRDLSKFEVCGIGPERMVYIAGLFHSCWNDLT